MLSISKLSACAAKLLVPPERAEKLGQSLTKIPYKDTFWKGTTRTRPSKDRAFPNGDAVAGESTALQHGKAGFWGGGGSLHCKWLVLEMEIPSLKVAPHRSEVSHWYCLPLQSQVDVRRKVCAAIGCISSFSYRKWDSQQTCWNRLQTAELEPKTQ